MSYLLRKITRSKWKVDEYRESKDLSLIPADALTYCMKTDSNKLSVWESEVNTWDENLDLLATLFSSSDGPSKSHVVIINKDFLISRGVTIVDSPGDSAAILEVNNKHRDLSALNYHTLGIVAKEMADALVEFEDIESEECLKYKIFTQREAQNIVQQGIDKGFIDPVELKKNSERWTKKLNL